jgi:hypothetical protein
MEQPSIGHVADVITEVIRPAAVVPEAVARKILKRMTLFNIYTGSLWAAESNRWVRYDHPWIGPGEPGRAQRLGTLKIAYGSPRKYEITIYQVMITQFGADSGCTVQSLCDEALGFGGLTLADCPRAALTAPPKPFRF